MTNLKIVFIFSTLIISGCDIIKPKIKSYDDCILENINEIKNENIINTIKTSCKEKFPISFDFIEISKKANVLSWNEVIKGDEYKKLERNDKNRLIDAYFDKIIKRRVHPDFTNEAKTEFENYAWGLEFAARKSTTEKDKQK